MENVCNISSAAPHARIVGATALMAHFVIGAVIWKPAAESVAIAPTPTVSCPTMPSGARLDCSGQSRSGIASFYAQRFGGRTMADGTPMRLHGDNAASLTLPLGTTAVVTNLETGKSAKITIRDRGPYVHGRIVDLSPATARKIGIATEKGLARVTVTPIAVPLADGSVRRGLM